MYFVFLFMSLHVFSNYVTFHTAGIYHAYSAFHTKPAELYHAYITFQHYRQNYTMRILHSNTAGIIIPCVYYILLAAFIEDATLKISANII